MDEITVQIPGTTANIGPGYDCLGIALRIANRVRVWRARRRRPHPMVDEAADGFFASSRIRKFGFDWEISGDVPVARGLGSSVTLRLGILHGLNRLAGNPLNRRELFTLCSQLEGHPDNAAPASFGGFTVADGVHCARFPVEARLRFVLLIPPFEVATEDARRVLPDSIPLPEAVTSAAAACRIVAAFATAKYTLLKDAFDDYFHQPYRRTLIPFLDDVIRAGTEAGALGGFLSGSGSTIACVTLKNPARIGRAMQNAAPPNCAIVITEADNRGVRIQSER